MFIWTNTAMEVLRDATAKADTMNHREVLPLHLLWAATGRIGFDALRHGKNDQQQARLKFQVERDLAKLPVTDRESEGTVGACAAPGPRLQRLLLRAADYSARRDASGPAEKAGRIGLTELMRALLQDDHRAAGLLRTREDFLVATA